MARECGTKPKIDDALAYLKEVKEAFPDERGNYHIFLNFMMGFKDKAFDRYISLTDIECIVASLKELFKGQTDLLLKFNMFLPNGYEITLPLEGENHPNEDYQPHRRMNDEHGKATAAGSLSKNKEDEQALGNDEGADFLSKTKVNEHPKKRMLREAREYVDKIKENEQDTKMMQGGEDDKVLNIVKKCKKDEYAPKGTNGGNEEAMHIMDKTNGGDKQSPNLMHGGYEEAEDFLKKIKNEFPEDGRVYKSVLDIMEMLGEGKKSMTEAYNEIAALFVGHTYLLHELTHFLPSTSGAKST